MTAPAWLPSGTFPRVLVRVVKSPQIERGEVLAVFVDSRTISDPGAVVYSFTTSSWRVEHHRRLMWRTKRATPIEVAEAREALTHIGQQVTILQSAPQVIGAGTSSAPEGDDDRKDWDA